MFSVLYCDTRSTDTNLEIFGRRVRNGISPFLNLFLDGRGIRMVHNTLDRVIKSISVTTRYPLHLLTAQADLENDLGIDSVKRLEIVLDLSEEFKIPLDREPRDTAIRSIQDVANWVDTLTSQSSPVLQSSPVSSPRFDQPSGISDPASLRSKPVLQKRENSYGNAQYLQMSQPSNSQGPSVRLERSFGVPSTSFGRALHGRVAFVTGSGRGVGQTIARLLASRGATVIVNSFHSRELGEQTAAEINESGNLACHMWGSIANPQHVDEIFKQIQARFGRLDILICNASDGRIGNFLELNSDDWDRAFRTNVVGHHQCSVRAASLMRSHGGGSIVTISAVGSHGYIEGLGSQGVVKAAVETMTRYLACELGQYGIRVNCVVGGPVYGELLSKFPNARSTQHHWESMTPDGTLCTSMDLANAVGFLVSDEAGGVNGSIWNVDHGFSAIADGRPLRYSAAQQTVG
jgi:NAD(P)-dependent dehydrogenase (short-subunit alcohol dehydrogenase family)/acyl carrier protein